MDAGCCNAEYDDTAMLSLPWQFPTYSCHHSHSFHTGAQETSTWHREKSHVLIVEEGGGGEGEREGHGEVLLQIKDCSELTAHFHVIRYTQGCSLPMLNVERYTTSLIGILHVSGYFMVIEMQLTHRPILLWWTCVLFALPVTDYIQCRFVQIEHFTLDFVSYRECMPFEYFEVLRALLCFVLFGSLVQTDSPFAIVDLSFWTFCSAVWTVHVWQPDFTFSEYCTPNKKELSQFKTY